MSTAIATLFDEGLIPAEDRDWLRQQEDAIGTYARRFAADAVTIGTVLLEVQQRVGRHFEDWLASRTPFSLRTAQRMIAGAIQLGPVAEVIRAAEPGAIERCALHLIAAESTSPAARAEAIKVIQEGKPLTFSRMKELVAANRKPKPPALFTNDDEPRPETESAAAAQTVAMLEELCRITTVLKLGTVDDAESTDETVYEGFAIFKEDGIPSRSKASASFAEVVAHLAGHQHTKLCGQCFDRLVLEQVPIEEAKQKATYPLSFFVNKRGRTDGHASECKTCSRERTKRAKNQREAA